MPDSLPVLYTVDPREYRCVSEAMTALLKTRSDEISWIFGICEVLRIQRSHVCPIDWKYALTLGELPFREGSGWFFRADVVTIRQSHPYSVAQFVSHVSQFVATRL